MFAILIDQGPGSTPYQGITPLAGASLADCAETYFAQSEQLPTRFALAMGEAAAPGGPSRWRSGGVMLQHMPKASPEAKREATGFDGLLAAADLLDGADADNWERASLLLATVEATELIGPHVGPDRLLLRLFHEEGPRVYDPQPVRFGCTCGPDKVIQSLSIYSAEEIADHDHARGQGHRGLSVLRGALRVRPRGARASRRRAGPRRAGCRRRAQAPPRLGATSPSRDSSTAIGRAPSNSESTITRIAMIGTDRIAPGMPQIAVQTTRLTRITNGLRLSEAPISQGSMKLPTAICAAVSAAASASTGPSAANCTNASATGKNTPMNEPT